MPDILDVNDNINDIIDEVANFQRVLTPKEAELGRLLKKVNEIIEN